jgi:hypothetical protein
MTKLVWDAPGERVYETGVDNGVLSIYGTSYAWNGLVSVDENPSGGDLEELFYDGYKYEFGEDSQGLDLSISAYSRPDAFRLCEGQESSFRGLRIDQRARAPFSFSYRTLTANDEMGTELGSRLHFVYNCMVIPATKSNATLDDSAGVNARSWTVKTRPESWPNGVFSSHFIIDPETVYPGVLSWLQDRLYGSDITDPSFPTAQEIYAQFMIAD